jgi:hypothetical protein
MRSLLMSPDREFDPYQSLSDMTYRRRAIDSTHQLPPHNRTPIQDLELDTLLHAMAGEDEFLLPVAQQAVLSGLHNDVETVLYRQEVLKDCLREPAAVRQLYNLTVEAIERARKKWWSLSSDHPSSVLYEAIGLLEALLGMLRKLSGLAEEQAGRFESRAFTALFTMLRNELGDEYLATVQNHLTE